MIKYKLYQNTNKSSKCYGMWYARTGNMPIIELDGLAEHMANHNTPYSKGAIKGVIADMINCVHELILEGNKVKIPNLAIFSLGFHSTPSAERKDFSAAKNIKSVHLQARPCGSFTSDEIGWDAKVKEQGIYVDINVSAGGSSSGGSSSGSGGSGAAGGDTTDA